MPSSVAQLLNSPAAKVSKSATRGKSADFDSSKESFNAALDRAKSGQKSDQSKEAKKVEAPKAKEAVPTESTEPAVEEQKAEDSKPAEPTEASAEESTDVEESTQSENTDAPKDEEHAEPENPEEIDPQLLAMLMQPQAPLAEPEIAPVAEDVESAPILDVIQAASTPQMKLVAEDSESTEFTESTESTESTGAIALDLPESAHAEFTELPAAQTVQATAQPAQFDGEETIEPQVKSKPSVDAKSAKPEDPLAALDESLATAADVVEATETESSHHESLKAVAKSETPLYQPLMESAGKISDKTVVAPQVAQAPTRSPETEFAEANHARIITGMKTELLPRGEGSMQIRLDPPEFGALTVSVMMKDGSLTASFQTSNDDATKLLSHSLTQLKAALESQGVSVEKLNVQQAPRDQQSQNQDHQQNRGNQEQQNQAWQEQQRKQMLQRMWQRIANGADPLDLVA